MVKAHQSYSLLSDFTCLFRVLVLSVLLVLWVVSRKPNWTWASGKLGRLDSLSYGLIHSHLAYCNHVFCYIEGFILSTPYALKTFCVMRQIVNSLLQVVWQWVFVKSEVLFYPVLVLLKTFYVMRQITIFCTFRFFYFTRIQWCPVWKSPELVEEPIKKESLLFSWGI